MKNSIVKHTTMNDYIDYKNLVIAQANQPYCSKADYGMSRISKVVGARPVYKKSNSKGKTRKRRKNNN